MDTPNTANAADNLFSLLHHYTPISSVRQQMNNNRVYCWYLANDAEAYGTAYMDKYKCCGGCGEFAWLTKSHLMFLNVVIDGMIAD